MSKRLPALRSLQVFAVAAEQKSFKQAAEQLFITPQAVSLQMKSLEDHLGFSLFIRHPAAIELTAAGTELLAYVQRGLSLIEQGVQRVTVQQQQPVLRISASPWFAVHVLLPKLALFEQSYDGAEVQISTSVAFPDFREQRLDLAVQWGFGDWPYARKQLLLTDDKILVASPELLAQKPLSNAHELSQHRLLCTQLSVLLWQKLVDALGVEVLVAKQVLTLDSHAGLVEAAKKGLGVALISLPEAQRGIAEGSLLAPLGAQPISSYNPALMPGYWLIEHEDSLANPHVSAFKAWLKELLKSL